MESCDPVGTPMEIKDKLDLYQNGTPIDAMKYRSMIGALMYLRSSRSNIVHATCLCARYQAKPTEKHLKEVKRIFRYLWGTVNTGLWYSKDFGFELTGFLDADYAGCKDTFKSTSGRAQFLGKKLVSWSSKKQDCTALSTAETEYVSLSACCAQVLWMRTQLTYYGFHFNKIPIYCDSKSAIAISCNPVQHSRKKHIAVRYHFIKEHCRKGYTAQRVVKLLVEVFAITASSFWRRCVGTKKLRNDILVFQQYQGESLSDAWTYFKGLLQKVPHHGIDHWLQIRIFYDHDFFHLKYEIDCATDMKMPVKKAKKESGAENGTKNEPIKKAEREEAMEAPNSQPLGYYWKHRINEKLIEGLVDNHRFNDSLLGVRVGKMKGKTYNLLHGGLFMKQSLG
nr:uncharacterized mitochondrial protein AtMg00810-like [Tanacetum cinerariifolium]